MSSDKTPEENDRGRVLQFRPRQQPLRAPVRAFSNLSAGDSPVRDVGNYGRGEEDTDDYAHRMKMNALAVVLLAVLIGGGMWIVDTMAQMRKNQDCVLMGRRNCAQVTTPLNDRTTVPVSTPLTSR